MKKLIFTTTALLLMSLLNAQQYITEEREIEIKTTENYYWAEGQHQNNEDEAKSIALGLLGEEILKDAVNKSIKNEEDLKELEMSIHFDRIQQDGTICVLAWIPKEEVFVTTRRPIKKPIVKIEEDKPVEQPKEVNVTDIVLQKLTQCNNYKEVNKIIKQNGLIRGEFNSTEGFANVGQCIIAVFSSDGILQALLDKGDKNRIDLISGETINDFESYYRNKNYNLLYFQQK